MNKLQHYTKNVRVLNLCWYVYSSFFFVSFRSNSLSDTRLWQWPWPSYHPPNKVAKEPSQGTIVKVFHCNSYKINTKETTPYRNSTRINNRLIILRVTVTGIEKPVYRYWSKCHQKRFHYMLYASWLECALSCKLESTSGHGVLLVDSDDYKETSWVLWRISPPAKWLDSLRLCSRKTGNVRTCWTQALDKHRLMLMQLQQLGEKCIFRVQYRKAKCRHSDIVVTARWRTKLYNLILTRVLTVSYVVEQALWDNEPTFSRLHKYLLIIHKHQVKSLAGN